MRVDRWRCADSVLVRCAVALCLLLPALAFGECPERDACLTWTYPTSNTDGSSLTDLAGFRLYRKCDNETSFTLAASVLSSTPAPQGGETGTWADVDVGATHYRCDYQATAHSATSESVPTGPVGKPWLPGFTQSSYEWSTVSTEPPPPPEPSVVTEPVIAHWPSVNGGATPTAGQIFIDNESTGAIPYPASVSNNDIAYLWIGVGDMTSATILLTADGAWTALGDYVYNAGAGDEAAARLFWRRCNGTEGGTTTSVTFDNDAAQTVPIRWGMIVTVSGAVKSGTPHEGYATNNGSDATAESPSTVTTGVDRLALRFWFVAEDDQGTEAAPSGWTRRVDLATANFSDAAITGDSKVVPTATTEASTTRTASADGWVSFGLAVLPQEASANLLLLGVGN